MVRPQHAIQRMHREARQFGDTREGIKAASNWYFRGWGKAYRQLEPTKLHWIRYCRDMSLPTAFKLAKWSSTHQVPSDFQDTDADEGWMHGARLAGALRRAHRTMCAENDATRRGARGASEAKEGDGGDAALANGDMHLSLSLLNKGRLFRRHPS